MTLNQQHSFHWNGASLGDADLVTVNAADGIGYRLANEDYTSPFVDTFFRATWNGDGNRGVLSGWLNELQVTVGAGVSVDVGTGGAVVYGMPYENTVAVNLAVVTPTSDTRYDYVVLRRDWAAQEIRATIIQGTEGGGVPALTQSPAPDGTGIYDVPLAYLSVTTGGVIAVTDAREYCTYSTALGADSISTTSIANNAVVRADRETRTRRMWLSGGDLEPALNGGDFHYDTSNWVDINGATTWGGAANNESWRVNGTGYKGVYASFFLPENYASGNILTNVWWVCNASAAFTVYVRSAAQLRPERNAGLACGWANLTGQRSVYVSASEVIHTWYKTQGVTIEPSHWAATDVCNLRDMIHYSAWMYNSAGTEDWGIMAIELVYTGY